MRFVCDPTWTRVGGHAVMAGSPHRLFRLTPAGERVIRAIERGEAVAASHLVDRLLDAGAIHPAPISDGDVVAAPPDDVTIVTPQLGGSVAADGRITVDDGSAPALDGATVRLEQNVGPAGARNAGRRVVTTPFVLFVDADVDIDELDPDHPGHRTWWTTMLRHFDDPDVGLVAPRVTGDDDSSLDLGPVPGRVRSGTRIGYVPGAALLIRVAAFDDVGGFDPTMRSGEDVDLVWRLDQAGWRCRYEPAATAHHRPRPTFGERLRQQVKYGSSSGPLALRHPRALAPFRSGVWTAAAWGLLGAGRPKLGLGLAAASVAHFARRAPDLDARAAARVAAVGHLMAGRQLAVAIRRAWWPLFLPVLWSRRVRLVLAAAFVVDPRRAANDVAFSVGLWQSVLGRRTSGPLRPRIDVRSR